MNRAENPQAQIPFQIDPSLPVEDQVRRLNEAVIEIWRRVKENRDLLYSIDEKVNR